MKATAGMDITWGPPKAFGIDAAEVSLRVSPAGDVESSATTTLPADAIVTSGTATITVQQAGTIAAGKIAQVRPGDSGAVVVIDFGALRTVSALALPSGRRLTTLRRWTGAAFGDLPAPAPDVTRAVVSLPEIQTERLELTFDKATTADTVATKLLLTLPGAPTDLTLDVAGVRAWSRPGPVRLAPPATGGTPEARFTVPLATELQAALGRGANPVVTLRTATPCILSLGLNLAFVRKHVVALPPSGIVVGGDAEAEFDAFLPLPADAPGWQVVRVELAVTGRLPSWRSWPLPDPALNDDARLLLDPAHSYAARLPAGWLAPLAEFTGIRLPLLLPAGFGGAEIAAVLYQGSLDQPVAPVPAARFLPTDIAAEPAGATRWVALMLAKPVKVPPGATWWVELSATRGSGDWPLSAAIDDSGADSIRLRRSLPGPPFRPLAVAARRGAVALVPAGRLRLLGTPQNDDQRPAVVPLLQGSGTPQVAPGFTPSAASGTVTLTPAVAATAARGEIADGTLRLRLRLHSAGQVTLNAANVFYRTP